MRVVLIRRLDFMLGVVSLRPWFPPPPPPTSAAIAPLWPQLVHRFGLSLELVLPSFRLVRGPASVASTRPGPPWLAQTASVCPWLHFVRVVSSLYHRRRPRRWLSCWHASKEGVRCAVFASRRGSRLYPHRHRHRRRCRRHRRRHRRHHHRCRHRCHHCYRHVKRPQWRGGGGRWKKKCC